MPTILVTGGAGFIGSCLVRQLVSQSQYHVVNFDKLTYAGNLDSLQSVESASNYDFVHGDITDRAAVEKVLEDFSPDLIANLAAESHVDRSIEHDAPFIRTNVVGTHTLLSAALAAAARRERAEGERPAGAWIADFRTAGRGHVFRDYARLETELLLAASPSVEKYSLLVRLAGYIVAGAFTLILCRGVLKMGERNLERCEF